MILLWKSIPLFERAGEKYPLHNHRSPSSLQWPMMLLCKGTYATHFKGQGVQYPRHALRSGVPAEINRYQIPKHQKGALWTTTNFKVTIFIRSPSHQFYKNFEISIIGMNFYNTVTTRRNILVRKSDQYTANFWLG